MTDDKLKKEQEQKAVIASATIFIRHILDVPDDKNKVIPHHKNLLLGQMIWMITEADGLTTEGKRTHYKHKLTYISEDTKKKRDKLGGDSRRYIKGLRHEHVYMKKEIIKQLLAKPKNVDKILKNAIGCVVTEKEHMRLHNIGKEFDGWKRYREAGIEVFNTKTNKWKKWRDSSLKISR